MYKLKKQEERDFMENLLVNLKKKVVNVSPQAREKIIMNLVNNAMIQGQPRRAAFAKKHGINPPNHVVISPTMICDLKCFGCYAWQYSKLSLIHI